MRTTSAYGIISACLMVVTANAQQATPTLFNKLMNCQGDCTRDQECASGVCFKRSKYQAVPGCKGKGHRGKDYCTTRQAINKAKAEAKEKAGKAAAAANDCPTDGDIDALSQRFLANEKSLKIAEKAKTDACPIDWSFNNWYAQTSSKANSTTKSVACDSAKAKVDKLTACTTKLMDKIDALEAAIKRKDNVAQKDGQDAAANRLRKAAEEAAKEAAAAQLRDAAAKKVAAKAAAAAKKAATKAAAAARLRVAAAKKAAKEAAAKKATSTPKKPSPFKKAPSGCTDVYSNCKQLADRCSPCDSYIPKACCKSCHASAQSEKCIEARRNDIVGGQGRIDVKFDHSAARGTIASNSTCSKDKRNQIIKASLKMEHWMRKAYRNWDQNMNKKLFKKWFGVSTVPHSDENVKIRFKNAMDMMFAKKKLWKLMCCKKAIGGCKSCSGRTLAYVTHFTRRGEKNRTHSNVNIRMCELSFEQKYKEVRIGMTILHELMHMSSKAGDQGYSKSACFKLAKSDPERARKNAAAYVYYAIESSMTKDNYEKYSSGGSILNEGCSDTWGNCYQMARGCCHGRTVSGGESLAKGCCAACNHFDKTQKCKDSKKAYFKARNARQAAW